MGATTMSSSNVQAVIRKAVSDPVFRDLLINQPSHALADFDLTANERASLIKMDKSTFNVDEVTLEERVSRAMRGGWDGN